MHHIKLGSKSFSGPDNWSGLTPKRFLQWVRWQLSGADPAGLFGLLQLWFKLRYWHLIRLTDEQRIFLLEQTLSFQLKRPDSWMLPRVWLFGRRYVGPGDRLKHLTFGEFMFAEAARSGFDQEPTNAQLSELAAALYRPYGQGAGQRAAFVQARLEGQERRFAWLSRAVLEGIRINYYGCLDAMPDRFPYLFPRQPQGAEGGGTWLDVGLSLARQTGALGNFHELEKTNVYLALTLLNEVLKEQADLKKHSDA